MLTIEPEGVIADWCFDDDSGRLFATVYDGAKAIEVDPGTGKLIREFPLADKPRDLLVKGGKLVVTVEAGLSVYLIDLKTNKVSGRIQLEGAGPNALFASDVKNGLVYVATSAPERSFGGGTITQIDLATGKVRKTTPAGQLNHGYLKNVAMTPDGTLAVVDGRGAGVSPSGAALVSIDENEATFSEVFRHHNSFPPITADPYGRHFAVGGDLYRANLQDKVRQFKGVVIGFHPTGDLVAGYAHANMYDPNDTGVRTLSLQTFSTAKVLKEITLMSATPRSRNSVPRPGERTYVASPVIDFDAKNHRVFVGHGPRAFVVDLKAAGVKVEPLLMLDIPSRVVVNLGETLKLPLKVGDPKLSDVKYALDDAPKGAAIADNAINWTPESAQVGEHTLKISAQNAGSSDSSSVVVAVRRPGLDLGGAARDIAVDLAGDRALLLINLPNDPRQPRRPDQFGRTTQPTELVLVDLKAMKVTARRQIDEPIQSIALTSTAAFFAPQSVARIQRLKLADLADEGRIFTNGNVSRLELLPFGDLAVVTPAGVERSDGVRLTPAPWLSSGQPMQHQGQILSQRVNGGVALGSLIIDTAGKATWMLRTPGAVPVVASDPQNRNFHGASLIGLWGRTLMHNQLAGLNNTAIARLSDGQSVLLEAFPAVATLVTERSGQNQRTRTVRLEFRDLIDGTTVEPLTLSIDTLDQYQSRETMPGKLVERNGKLIVASNDQLFHIDLPSESLKKLATPLYFSQKMLPMQAPVKGTLTVKTEIFGGKGEKTFELPGSPEGTSIDPKTGVISIDTELVWKRYIESVEKGASVQRFRYAGTTAPSGLVEQAQAAYRALMSRDVGAGNYPIAVHLRASAADVENQKSELSGYVILIGPATEVSKAEQRREALAAEAIARAKGLPNGMPATQPGAQGGEAALLARIAELEEQNRQLQSQIDLLKDLVRGRPGGAPTTQPSR